MTPEEKIKEIENYKKAKECFAWKDIPYHIYNNHTNTLLFHITQLEQERDKERERVKELEEAIQEHREFNISTLPLLRQIDEELYKLIEEK